MEKTVVIKRVFRNEGTKKNGKSYLLTKILADGVYFATFKDWLKDAKEGMIVNLEYEPSSKEGNFNITKVISLLSPSSATPSLPPSNQGNPKQAQAKANESPFPADEAQLAIRVANRLNKAYDIVDTRNPNAKEYEEYLIMVNEVFRQLQSEEWLRIEVAKAKLQKR